MSRTIKGVENYIKSLESSDLPVEYMSLLLNSRIMFSRSKASHARYLRLVVETWETRQRALPSPAEITQWLLNRIKKPFMEFHPAIIRLRCFLWLSCEIFDLDGMFLQNCSVLFNRWALTTIVTDESYLFEKLMLLPHAFILIPIARLTVEVAMDIIELFADEKQSYLADSLLLLLPNTWEVSFQYYLHGNLDAIFKSPHLELKYRSDRKTCVRWLLRVAKTCGREVMEQYVTKGLEEQMSEGYL